MIVELKDDDMGSTSPSVYQCTVPVINVPPEFEVPPSVSVNEGELFDFFDLANITAKDAGIDDVLTYTIEWGNGDSSSGTATSTVTGGQGQPQEAELHQEYVYPDDGQFQISVTVSDATDTVTKTFSITVNNTPPRIQPTQPLNVQEGQLLSELFIFEDDGFNDSFRYEVHWGDGTIQSDGLTSLTTSGSWSPGGVPQPLQGATQTVEHTYGDDKAGPYQLRVKVIDVNDSSSFDEELVTVNVSDGPISVVPNFFTFSTSGPVYEEGTLYIFHSSTLFTFSDPSFNPLGTTPIEEYLYAIDWDDYAAGQRRPNSGQPDHQRFGRSSAHTHHGQQPGVGPRSGKTTASITWQ